MKILQSDVIKNLNNQFENKAELHKNYFAYEAQIGTGAFGKVFRVRSQTTSNKYALKVLSKKQIIHLKLTQQLQNEIIILTKCNHPNIIKIYAVFEDSDYIYIVMELAQDGNLFSHLRKAKSFSEDRVKVYITQIIKVLMYLHQQSPPILHRDLKPENILVSNDGLKICDFGWSNVNDDIRNTFCGTPDYLAPEMILGTGHDEKLDVWTVGVLMYELLYGKTPFRCDDQIKDKRMQGRIIEKNILKGNINFDSKKISSQAKSAIRIMLNPDKQQRPYAKDLLNIEFFQQQQPKVVYAQTPISKQHVKKSSFQSQNGQDVYKNQNTSKNVLEDLQKLLDEKDKIIFEQQQEIQVLKEVVNNKDLVNKIQKDIDQQEETIKYMFNQTKKLSTAISEFYRKEIHNDDANVTKINVLSYQSAKQKLEKIFQKFREMKTGEEQPNPSIEEEDDEEDYDGQYQKTRSMLPLGKKNVIKGRSCDKNQFNLITKNYLKLKAT